MKLTTTRFSFPTREIPLIKNVRLYVFKENEFEKEVSVSEYKRNYYLEKLKKLGEFNTSKNKYRVYGCVSDQYLGVYEFLSEYIISDIVYISLVQDSSNNYTLSKVMIDVDNSNPVFVERSRTTPSFRSSIKDLSKDQNEICFDWEPLLKLEEFLKNGLESGELLNSCMQFLEN
jgi:hypothetical protein|nr:MAG TPA: hypothetical protein [Caudoviricetes sp.]